ncbi:MAG TPA: PIN domain-containing protein [Candidatus Binatia bacterium]|nr:PIN domain-containing protein [Candidatus Binatia bacterium]
MGDLWFEYTCLPSDEARLYRAQSVRSRYGLLTNDSLILAAMEENGVDSLATRDSDFDHISNLKIYKPTDINTVTDPSHAETKACRLSAFPYKICGRRLALLYGSLNGACDLLH